MLCQSCFVSKDICVCGVKDMQNVDLNGKTVLVTGAAGFIGSNLCKRLLETVKGVRVIGVDSMNDYYDVRLKEERLKALSSDEAFVFVKGTIADKELIDSLFNEYKPDVVVNLAAQAGVRYSIINPDAYVESNLIGFFNILNQITNRSATAETNGHIVRNQL